MPKIFEYLGILIFFYSNEHQPVHVHATYQGYQSKAEFVIIEGVIKEIIIQPIRGAKPLPNAQLNDFQVFLGEYGEQIVQKWIDYFVLHKHVNFERINKRVK
jgi:hypothetical protein